MHSLAKGANTPVVADVVLVAVTWSTAGTPAGSAGPEVDVCALLCGPDGRVGSDEDFIFFNQTTHPSGALTHRGASSAGGRAADTLEVHLARIPAHTETVVIAASAATALGGVPELAVSATDAVTRQPLFQADLDVASETVIIAGELYRRGGAWKFRAVAQGYNDGLAGLARDYGITVDDPGPTPGPAPAAAPVPTPSPSPGQSAAGIDWLNPPVPAGYEI